MTSIKTLLAALATTAVIAFATPAAAETLRLLTWGGYAPDAIVKKFEQETGITVEVTVSNNEDIISKLRATGGAGFDLAQPSADRITGPQEEYGIYKPLDLSKIDTSLFIPDLLEASKKVTTADGKVYGISHLWGTAGIVVNSKQASDVKGWGDLCTDAHKGKVSMRLKRIPLLGMAFAAGDDPFAAYGDKAKYQEIIDKAGKKLADCKANVKAYWSGSDDLLNMLRSGEVVASESWDSTGFKLNAENPDFVFVAPDTGALGWIDTFALPAKGKADDAAYKWINFVMKPENAAAITEASGSFSASKGADDLVNPALRKAFKQFFPPDVIAKVKWFPPIPAGFEDMEGKVLDRIAAQ
ncbi:spermidine/putrescine ABC transporter substrate-binding protein [Labrys miyagiensis]|uniref:Spermidine/putrescine ABC transporter substrate-binding protein n=1 Tax=Labrys miyagiensis TaxID=346912 RepID=A0ABQ6CHV9_9HYPH|nr:spermidine/putrescine ABC transporter substrate-binding protein [Labrys miyagiensis]